MPDDSRVVVSKLEIDASQPEALPAKMAGVGAAVVKAFEQIDAGAKMTASELKLLTAALQKETAAMVADAQKLTISVQEESSKRIQAARVAAAETIDLNRAALAELLQLQKAADEQALAILKAGLTKHQKALDAGHETRARKQRAANALALQQAKASADAIAQTAKQDHQTKLQDTRLIANSATTQATIQSRAMIAASNNATKVTIANSKNATAVQLAGINQVTQAATASARAQLAAQQALAKSQLSAQQHQQRMQLQKQAQQGGGGLLATLGQAGGAIYAIKTVVQGIEQVVQMGVEIGKLTTAYDRQMIASKNLAGGIGNLDKLMEAYTRATGGAVDRVTSLQDITRLQAIGFGDSAEELERFVKVSRGISLAVGKDMADITQEVALTIANQSTRRLDQIGLGVEEVRDRIEELREANQGMTREMAFQEAVLQVAGEKYGDLVNSLEAQATGVEKLTASWKDYLLVVAQGLSGPIQAAADAISKQIDEAAEKSKAFQMQQAVAASYTIPHGAPDAMTLEQAKFRRDEVAAKRQVAIDVPYGNEAGHASQIAVFDEELRQLNTTIAGINAKIALATNTFEQPMGSGAAWGQRPRSADNGLDDEQYQVLFDLEQERADMEEGFAKQRNDETASYEEQRTKTIASFEKQLVRDAEDFALQRQRAQEDHQKAMADVVEDGLKRQLEMAEELADKIAKANRDSARRVSEINEDYDRKVENMREDSADRIVEMEEDEAEREQELKEDSAEKIAEMEKDYAKQRKDNLRDYNDSVMSAAANLDARAVWEAQKRFAREEQEAAESHAEKVAEEQKSLDKALAEQQEKLAEKIAEEKKSLDKSILQATEMRDEQIKDEGEALKQRNEDARIAHAEQLQDAIDKDAQRLLDMQTDFDARLKKEDADRAIRLGRMQTDHNDQLTELGEQHKKRMTQIGIQEGEARKAFDEAYTDRLEDAGIFNTAWMLAQAKAEEESLTLFKKMFEGMNQILGKTDISTENGLSPVVAGWKKQLTDQRDLLVSQLDNGLTPEEYRRVSDLIAWINEQLGVLAGASDTVEKSSVVTGSSLPTVNTPAVASLSGAGAAVGMNVVIEEGAIVITPLPGQSAAAVGDEFEKRLLDVLKKVASQ